MIYVFLSMNLQLLSIYFTICDMSNPQSSSANDKSKKDDIDKTLWKYVTNVVNTETEDGAVKGGNVGIVCDICGKFFQGTYTRVRAHLLGIKGKGIGKCTKTTKEMVRQMTNLDEEAERRKKANAPNYVPLPIPGVPPYSETSDGQPSDVQTKKRKENPITKLYDVQARNHLDAEIARMFYTGGLPFNLARNPHYLKAFQFAADNNLSGYIPPNYNKLRTTLLEKELEHLDMLLEPIKATWREKGVTIVSDGWSDPQRRPLINFMATSESGPIFIKSVNCFGEVKDRYFIADLMEEVIEEIGPMNVVEVITDNASNCKGAGELIEIKYP